MKTRALYFFNSMGGCYPLYLRGYQSIIEKDVASQQNLFSVQKAFKSKTDLLSQLYFEWARAHQIYSGSVERALVPINFSLLITNCYHKESIDDLLLLTKFLFYFFSHDDICDKNEEKITEINAQHIKPILGEAVETEDSLIRSLALIIAEIDRRQEIGYNFKHFKKSLLDYFSQTESLYRMRQGIVSLQESDLLCQRMQTGGVEQMFEFGLALRKVQLSQENRENIRLKSLIDKANLIIVLTNDIASFQKEKEADNGLVNAWSNLVLYKIYVHHFTPKHAQQYVTSFVNILLEEFNVEAEQVENDANIHDYIELMRDWIRGNIEWSIHTSRYNTDTVKVRKLSNDYQSGSLATHSSLWGKSYLSLQEMNCLYKMVP